jgi:hypothetical protein
VKRLPVSVLFEDTLIMTIKNTVELASITAEPRKDVAVGVKSSQS